MTNCAFSSIEFPSVKKRKIQADFSGGEISSDGGVLLLRQADRLTGLTAAVGKVLKDAREKGKVKHDLLCMLRQRIYGLALGYEDLNDQDSLRGDLAFQTAVEKDRELASPPTLCRSWRSPPRRPRARRAGSGRHRRR